MMRVAGIILFVLIAVAAISCQSQPDLDAVRAEILELHRSNIQAHLDKDAAFIARPTSPDYISVSNGLVEKMNAGEMEQMLSEYLNATEFSEYRDVADPIIGVSRDGSLAWAVVRVRVAGTRAMADGDSVSFDTRWAWITLYERDGDGWLRLADVSTNRPFEEGP